MYCRHCFSRHLLQLEKKLPQDNEVFRCQECGFLFSPSASPPDPLSISDGEGEAEPGVRLAGGGETNPLGASSGATDGAAPPQLLVGPGE